ncbi:hypothetical protein D8B29_08190 [Verminephrobacter eiseniae]|nr:hypothetical protein [Verminephrobacter eiseniae]MCW5301578.1 hypothetical protein [Verminephrobacter eiseniae]MCW8179595.1 hypothetical protein [Verminephrobacter eiseniae]MCW8189852.1 hypothetical protein [Verminephrobacter eiseniae]
MAEALAMTTPIERRNDHPASAGARRLGVYGLSVVEPDPRHMSTFSPSWYNAWEAKTYVQACKNRSKTQWSVVRFGAGASGSATAREISSALEISSQAALEEGRKSIETAGRLGKERLALLYFDCWGHASYLESAGSWKDSFSIDVIPWKILKELQVGAFSCKIRSGRGAFVDGLRIASHLLAADAADAVLIGGLFRFHPVLGFSAASATAKTEKRWLGRQGVYKAPVIERVGFALVGRPHSHDAGVLHATDSPSSRLSAGFGASAVELSQRFGETAAPVSAVIGGISPSSALAELEAEATLRFNRDAAYINIVGMYGDSGGINPLLALSHQRKLRLHSPGNTALLCMESGEGDVQMILLE